MVQTGRLVSLLSPNRTDVRANQIHPNFLFRTILTHFFLLDYKVDPTQLTGVNFPLPNTYAGSVSVNRSGHENNTLFFIAFEKEGQEGSLTAADGERSNEPWTIWLNGG
jgi:hypothetical protein